MKLKILSIILIMSSIQFANANIVCLGTSPRTGKRFKVEITKNAVVVTGARLSKPHVFKQHTNFGGLITAPGLAITMQNQYGCLREALIITDLQEPYGAGYMEAVELGTCAGGSTSDQICHAPTVWK